LCNVNGEWRRQASVRRLFMQQMSVRCDLGRCGDVQSHSKATLWQKSWMRLLSSINLAGQGGARSSCSLNLTFVAAARLYLRVTTDKYHFSMLCRSDPTIQAFVSMSPSILATGPMEISKLYRS
jgi:hypothetical protein